MGFNPYILIRSEISRFNIYNSQTVINISLTISLAQFHYNTSKANKKSPKQGDGLLKLQLIFGNRTILIC